MRAVLLTVFLFFPLSCFGQAVEIDRLYVQSDQSAGYILSHFGRLAPTGESLSTGRINCATDELRRSGMFKEISYEIVPVEKKLNYLYLHPTYNGNPSDYRIKEITIDGSLGLDEASLRKEMEKKGLKIGSHFMPYDNVGRAVFESINVRDSSEEKTLLNFVWINAYLFDTESIRLSITKGVPTCD